MRILIIDEVHPHLIEQLEVNGHSVVYEPLFDYAQTLEAIAHYHGVIVRSKFFIDRALMERGTSLVFLGRAGVGLDIFDTEAAEERNIQLINAAGANANAVAEHVLGMILCTFHHIHRADRQVQQFEWLREANRGTELRGKTIGIIGYGNVGRAVARKLQSFECTILAYDKYQTGFGSDFVKEVTLDELFEQAQLVTLHIPLTSETQGWCDASFFQRFRNPMYFFNTARGKIVDLQGLLQHIHSGKVVGVGLDVLENEDFEALSETQRATYQALFNTGKAILTPHVAGWSVESFYNISEVLAKKILDLTK